MVRHMAKPTNFALVAIFLSLLACARHAPSSFGGMEFVVPELFRESRKGESLSLEATESVGIYRPHITIHRTINALDASGIKKLHESLGRVSGLKVGDLEETNVAGHRAWTYSMRYVDTAARLLHNRRNMDWQPIEPSKVDSRETVVLIPRGESTYFIEFRCPESLYGKYRPEFDALLRSVKFKG